MFVDNSNAVQKLILIVVFDWQINLTMRTSPIIFLVPH